MPPRVTSADDLWSLVARLRFVMTDPTQLLSGSVASYVLGQLALGRKPADVAVPGLTGVIYPPAGASTPSPDTKESGSSQPNRLDCEVQSGRVLIVEGRSPKYSMSRYNARTPTIRGAQG